MDMSGTNKGTGNDWYSDSTGESLQYTYWAGGQPDRQNGCIYMDRSTYFTMYSSACTSGSYFTCEYTPCE
jgi:hypothetical protein